jgi:hypothetical protein
MKNKGKSPWNFFLIFITPYWRFLNLGFLKTLFVSLPSLSQNSWKKGKSFPARAKRDPESGFSGTSGFRLSPE